MRIPFVAIPKPGESLTSAIHRTLYIVGLQAPALARANRDWRKVNNFATEQQLSGWAKAAGLEPAQLRHTTFRRYREALPEYAAVLRGDTSIPAAARRTWLWPGCTQACMECLRDDDGAWQLKWRLPWTFLCTRHDAFLLTHCPMCKTRLYEHHRCPRRSGIDQFWVDVAPRYGHLLAVPENAEANGAEAHRILVAATARQIDAALTGNDVMVLDGQTVPASDYLNALRSITGLYIHLRRAQHARHAPVRRAVAAPPLNSQDRGNVLVRAATILTTPRDEAIARLSSALEHLSPPEGLTAWLDDHTLDTPVTQELFRQLTDGRTTVGRAHRALALDPRHIPQQLWLSDWTSVQTMLNTSEATGRAYCAMLLIKTQQQCTWTAAGTHLQLPMTLARNIARTGTANVLVHSHTLIDALMDRARLIASEGPVDFVDRRRHATQLMRPETLDRLRSYLDAPHLRDLMLRERIWLDWAHGHPALARRPTDTPLERSRTANQRKRWTTHMAAALESWCNTTRTTRNPA